MRTLVWSLALLIPLSLLAGCGTSSTPPKAAGSGSATGFKDASGKGNVKSAID